MTLTMTNSKEWLSTLDSEMEKQHGIKNFSKCCDLHTWERMYLGCEPQEAIDDEIFYSSQS